ncbi:hypothetical protein [Microvirga mediterraneensis]|uniref:Uncharacterized protein n=1 Tax=Microvirga mediterraneensis TaxID=2754695 RepID=A0A838BKP4_9HYPH|nr:hypothetical protein [Microvirga mediterraneensis]MBA1156020.1 hypothetical protein [Microvirga mediterraneensis]
MDFGADEDWPEGHIIVVPHAWRGDDLWIDMQVETQERIGAILCEMYAEFLQQPLPPGLEKAILSLETKSTMRRQEC